MSINMSWMLKLGLNGPSVCCRASRATRKTLLVISPEKTENKIRLIASLTNEDQQGHSGIWSLKLQISWILGKGIKNWIQSYNAQYVRNNEHKRAYYWKVYTLVECQDV